MNLLYADGGVIRSNPSPHGGTWAWCEVVNDKIVKQDSGVLRPKFLKSRTITNNQSELWAAYQAMIELDERDWYGTLHTDSQVTLRRITRGYSFKGIPNWLRDEVMELRKRRKWNAVLVGGHPTNKELKQGFRERNGLPVSKWQKMCDQRCRELADEFMSKRSP